VESQINALNYPSALTWSKRLFHLETHRSGLKECPAETRDILISLLGASSATESHAISTCQECKSCLSFQEPPIYKCSLVVKITGGVRSVTTSRVFLAHHLALPEKEGTTYVVNTSGLTSPMQLPLSPSLSTGVSHCWTALATYLSKESSNNDFCTGTNPHR
jgi:hypothetical protein